MFSPPRPPPLRDRAATLFVRIGDWFEASASGAGVFVIPALLALVLAAALAGVLGFP